MPPTESFLHQEGPAAGVEPRLGAGFSAMMAPAAWRQSSISPQASIEDAIRLIDAADLELLVVVPDGGHPIGTVTDFDIRSAVLRGVALETPILALLSHSELDPAVLGPETCSPLPWSYLSENSVVLMAGGEGRRLYPLTRQSPKPLLKVGGRPLLERILEHLCAQGLRRFSISLNYKGEMIEARIGDGSRWGVKIDYIRERQRLGTAGALGLIPQRPDSPFLVMNADLLTTLDMAQLFQYHQRQGAEATACIYAHQVQIPYGVVALDGYRLKAIEERPVQRFAINAGIYVLEPSVFDLVPRDQPLNMPDLLNSLLAHGRKTAVFPIREYWLDIGHKADLQRANADFPRLPPLAGGDEPQCPPLEEGFFP